jgi:acyl-CoA synthetase (AMP-forming)/AMP-acid ligase II
MDVVDVIAMKPVPRDGKTFGEIVMRGNNVMFGYYKGSSTTDDAFAGGWFHSRDLTVVHPGVANPGSNNSNNVPLQFSLTERPSSTLVAEYS